MAAREENNNGFHARVRTGKSLERLLNSIKECRETREQFTTLQKFLETPPSDCVCVLFGLRRTGKTTLLLQLAEDLKRKDEADSGDRFAKTAYVECRPGMTCLDAEEDFEKLLQAGFETVLFDEATLLGDFVSGSAFLPDIYGRSGMHIFMAGTDSLKFILAARDALYDRCILLHTTLIPYREWSRIRDIHDPKSLDKYIDSGGTLVLQGEFGRIKNDSKQLQEIKLSEYLDKYVVKNIQHSLRDFGNGPTFENLQDLTIQDNLTNLINRIVADDNHRFLLGTLNKKFVFQDYVQVQKNLDGSFDFKNHEYVDNINAVLELVEKELNIRNNNDDTALLDIEKQLTTARRFLIELDLFEPKKVSTYAKIDNKWNNDYSENILAMPGMRLCMSQILLTELFKDSKFSSLYNDIQKTVKDAIINQIHGRLLEDVIFLEILNTIHESRFSQFGDIDVIQLRFDDGKNKNNINKNIIDNINKNETNKDNEKEYNEEIDIAVTWNNPRAQCLLFEVKHSSNILPDRQAKNLLDNKKNQYINNKFGIIVRAAVFYNGPTSFNPDNCGVDYINAAEFLEALPDSLEAAMHPEEGLLEGVLDGTKARAEINRIEQEKEAKRLRNREQRERRREFRAMRNALGGLTEGMPAESGDKPESALNSGSGQKEDEDGGGPQPC